MRCLERESPRRKSLDGEEKTKVCVMVNSLGSTPLMELHVAARAARERLLAHDLNPVRVYVGSFMTALDMTGFSVTLCQADSARLARIDAPTGAPAWPVVARTVSVPIPVPSSPLGMRKTRWRRRRLRRLRGDKPEPPRTEIGALGRRPSWAPRRC